MANQMLRRADVLFLQFFLSITMYDFNVI